MRRFRRLLMVAVAVALTQTFVVSQVAGYPRVGPSRDARLTVHGSLPTERGFRADLPGSSRGYLGVEGRPIPQFEGEPSNYASFGLQRPTTPQLTGGFDAIANSRSSPGDPTGAIGDSWILTAVNTHYALYDRAGNPVIGPLNLSTLGADPSLFLFDPKVIYDQYFDTFLLVFLGVHDPSQTSVILTVAIPDGSADDPTTWCSSEIQGDQLVGDGVQFADYPMVGYTSSSVVISTNQFSFNNLYAGAQVLSLPQTSLYDCGVPLTGEVFVGSETEYSPGFPAFSIQPAQTVGTAGAQYLLSFERLGVGGRDSFIALWELSGSGSSSALDKVFFSVGKTRLPPPGTQRGGSITDDDKYWDPGDFRLTNAWFDADRGRLYAAHSIGKNMKPDVHIPYLESVIRWFEIDPQATLLDSALLRRGIVGEPETDAGWPAIGTDEGGNIFITYSRASSVTREFLSAWAAEIRQGTTSPTVKRVSKGFATYDWGVGSERWGDYNAISRDPIDGRVMVLVNQVAATRFKFQQTVDFVTHV